MDICPVKWIYLYYRFAFVEFSSLKNAAAVQKEKDGLEINGTTVQLAFAKDKTAGGDLGGCCFRGRRDDGGEYPEYVFHG